MRLRDLQKPLKEDATAGATASADVAAVVKPITYDKKKKKPVVIKRPK